MWGGLYFILFCIYHNTIQYSVIYLDSDGFSSCGVYLSALHALALGVQLLPQARLLLRHALRELQVAAEEAPTHLVPRYLA